MSSISPEFHQKLGRLESNTLAEIENPTLLENDQIRWEKLLLLAPPRRFIRFVDDDETGEEHLEEDDEEEEDAHGADQVDVVELLEQEESR